jgi:hypothetical protein
LHNTLYEVRRQGIFPAAPSAVMRQVQCCCLEQSEEHLCFAEGIRSDAGTLNYAFLKDRLFG